MSDGNTVIKIASSSVWFFARALHEVIWNRMNMQKRGFGNIRWEHKHLEKQMEKAKEEAGKIKNQWNFIKIIVKIKHLGVYKLIVVHVIIKIQNIYIRLPRYGLATPLTILLC